MRPTQEDREALQLLLKREDLSDYNAKFVENLNAWRGPWTERQAQHFDRVWEEHYGR